MLRVWNGPWRASSPVQDQELEFDDLCGSLQTQHIVILCFYDIVNSAFWWSPTMYLSLDKTLDVHLPPCEENPLTSATALGARAD